MAESSEASDNMSPSIIRRKSDPYSNWEAFRDSKIEISVGNPVMKEEFLTKYFVYKIQGTDLKGYFEVSRRYSDFEKIRQMLVMRWPGCFVPSLPVKQINNMGKGVVEDRKKHLDHFCKSMASIPHLHYSEVYQIFLRSKMGDIDPLLQTHQKIKYDDMVFRYTKVFAHLSGREINTDAQFKITSFGQFLQKSVSQFEKFKKIAKKYVVARKEFAAQFGEMHGMMANEYEKNIFSEYNNKDQQKHVFFNPTSNQNSDVEKVKAYESREAPDKLYEWIKNEGRDIEAFYEAFTQRDKYTELKNKTEKNSKADSKELQNQAAGKKTLKSLFTSGKKEENIAKLEDKINETGKDLENLILIQDLVTIVMAYEEIDKFKRIRVEKYFKLIGETAESEIDTFSAILDYWRTMLENPNVGQAMKS